MGTRKSISARLLILGCAGLICLGASFTWTGNGADDDWDTCGNWDTCTSLTSYPSSENDDATISGTYDVDLVDVGIDDLTLTGTITFGDADGDDPVLCLLSLTVTGDSTLDLTEGATISTDDGVGGVCAP